MSLADLVVMVLALAGAIVLIVGGYRLQNCAFADALLNGNSGPFAYTLGDDYVVAARWLSLGALGLAVARVLVASALRTQEGSTRLVLTVFVLASLSWFNQAIQDDRPILCGAEGAASAAFMLAPFTAAVALAALSAGRRVADRN